eukprot:CAMPEP_0201117796 /NCGR_PEP_ID=MMETSP0850-20130426/1837_1 /ASSEMBLY_ACC=CAM_ASM_000622 /TAXON_ID=183588 /ORGANISM="Pseudo-nitzschia fraudulenta, Strain WWA7" /LENGTH=41 /DNA_ID= /DNA_START= /DNA_END= /DNA_ORIENTATION=
MSVFRGCLGVGDLIRNGSNPIALRHVRLSRLFGVADLIRAD